MAPRDRYSLLQFYLDGPKDSFLHLFFKTSKKKNLKK